MSSTTPASRLGQQLTEVLATLQKINVQSALIGGLALSSHHVIRATQDIDLLVDQMSADSIHEEFIRLEYRCLHRSTDVGNYQRQNERGNFSYASRPAARRLLANAVEQKTSLGILRVISGEGLIGFKLQGVVNDPRRTQDLEDIKALLRAKHGKLNLAEVREYFRMFDREALLDELLK